jgi:hypothetical protein
MTKTYSTDAIARAQGAALDLLDAVNVLRLTPAIRAWLAANDPKALAQADAAARLAERDVERASEIKRITAALGREINGAGR